MMRFARWVYRVAGIYGLVVLAPLYFTLEQFNADHPPDVTHVEFYYGFVSVALAWQIAFLIIAHDPLRYRPLMITTWFEKFIFFFISARLHFNGVLPAPVALGAAVDGVLGVLFVVAWIKVMPSGEEGI